MRLSGNVAIVTGGGRGIGAAICQSYIREGASVVVTDIDYPAAQAVVNHLPVSQGVAARALVCDITDPGAVNGMVEQVLDWFGKVDILVNNAGICPLTPLEEISPQEWDSVLNVNLKGAFLCSQKVIPHMAGRGYGRIINISSVSGKMGGVFVGAHYAASKAGLIALTFCLARSYASKGITANAICPATVESEMTSSWPQEQLHALVRAIPLGRLGSPSDVASAAVFLASKEAGFITGEVLDVNGGFLMD
jgi:3-oxoacyl-[acyl-carrier protein] reductase